MTKFFVFIATLLLFLSYGSPVKAGVIAKQTDGYTNTLPTWAALQVLGNNLSGKLVKLTFRVHTNLPNTQQFEYTGNNTRIYDRTIGSFVAQSCLPPNTAVELLTGLTFSTNNVPEGFEDVTVDFSCNNFSFTPGHDYLLQISNANQSGAGGANIQLAAVNYSGNEQDFYPNGGLRYASDHGVCLLQFWPWNYPDSLWGCNVWFTPRDDLYFILSDDTPDIPAKTPLIFIPGIGGSELKVAEDTNWSKDNGHGGIFTHNYPAGEKVWVNEDKAKDLGDDDYFDILKLKTDGQTPEANLELTGGLFGAYQTAIDFFASNGYTLNQDLFIFPYDWRKDLSLTKDLLDQKIAAIKTQTGVSKVDIVSHSMGGLVARSYINDASKAFNIRKLIELGTPHLGSVKQVKGLIYGDCLTDSRLDGLPFCIGISPSAIKDVIQNMTSGFELSPSQTYYNFYAGADSEHPLPFKDDRDMDSNNVTGALNYSQTKTLLSNLGHNTNLFNPAETFHNIDNNLSNTNGVDVTLIAGSGIATLGQIIEKYAVNFLGIQIPKKDEVVINGDNTVPLFSASLNDPVKNLSLLGNTHLFYSNQTHGQLVTIGPAMDLVKNILDSNDSLPTGISNEAFKLKGHLVSVHSPVNILITDYLDNQTGIDSNGEFKNDIPGSSIETIDDAKFIWLPDSGQYNVKLFATDNGSFDLKIRTFEDDVNTKTTLYKNIPVNNLDQGQFILDTDSNTLPNIQLDNTTIPPTGTISGNEQQDTTSPEVQISFNPQTKKLDTIGSDSLGAVTTSNPSNSLKIFTDLADNSTQLSYKENILGKSDTLNLNAIKYNKTIFNFTDNQFQTVYATDPRSNQIISLIQNLNLSGDKNIQANYNSTTNKTIIITINFKTNKTTTETKNGVILVKLNTQNGKLIANY